MVKKLVSNTHLVIFGLLCYYASNLDRNLGISAEETCSWNSDGSQVCKESEDGHNVWTDPLVDDEVQKSAEAFQETVKNENSDINELELTLFVMFAGQLKDWDPKDGLAKFNSEIIVHAISNAFNSFDQNDDGFLEFPEMETVLLKSQMHENLDSIKGIFDEYTGNRISIFECFKIFHKFNGGKETVALLTPFEKLQFMPPGTAKKIIQGSVQMFIDSDKNYDGKLDKEEFFLGMKRAQEKRKEFDGHGKDAAPEQLDALFSLVDKDSDDYLTYVEFQGTLPDKPKTFGESVDKVFEDADANSDTKLSEVEFMTYLKTRSKENSQVVPTDKEVSEAFSKLDVNEDDFLSRDEMMRMFDEVKRAQEHRIVEAFNSFDKDADGSLSLDELEEIVKGLEENTGQKLDAKVFLTMLDQDMNKKVSLQEMTAMLTQLIK